MIDAMDDKEYMTATADSPSTFLEMIRFWHKRVDAETVCAFCERLSKYVGRASSLPNYHRFLGVCHEFSLYHYSILFMRDFGKGELED